MREWCLGMREWCLGMREWCLGMREWCLGKREWCLGKIQPPLKFLSDDLFPTSQKSALRESFLQPPLKFLSDGFCPTPNSSQPPRAYGATESILRAFLAGKSVGSAEKGESLLPWNCD